MPPEDHARLRLWAAVDDYMTFDAEFQALPQDNKPFQQVTDQYDLDVIMQYPGDAGKFWVKTLPLVLHSKKRLLLNNSDAPTRRNLRQGFEYHVRDNFTHFVIFIQGNGTDSEGNAVVTKDYYKGYVTQLSPWFRSNLNSASGIPAYLPLTFSATVEGTFTNFDSVVSVTPRTTRP